MSAWKNVAPSRAHRERSQPSARQHLGFLEKHKDYKKRAANFHSKEKRLLALQRRAALRNPDEFSLGMTHAKTERGVHVAGGPGKVIDKEELALLKTQDLAYVEAKHTSELRSLERLRASLHHTAAPPQNKRLVFVDSDDDSDDGEGTKTAETKAVAGRKRPREVEVAAEPDAKAKSPESHRLSALLKDPSVWSEGAGVVEAATEALEKKDRAAATRKSSRKSAAIFVDGAAEDHVDPATKRRLEKETARAYEELKARETRTAKLASAVAHFRYQKQLKGKGRRKKVESHSRGVLNEFGGRDGATRMVWKTQRRR